MRIAVVSAFLFDDCIGGAENHIRFLCRELIGRGHEIVIFKPVLGRGPERYTKVVDGLEIRCVARSVPYDPRRLSGSSVLGRIAGFVRKVSFARLTGPLCGAIREFRPDVVWQHDFLSSWLASRQLSRSYPVVLTNHQAQYLLMRRYAIGRWMLRRLMSHYAAVIGPSHELTPVWRKQCYTILNGVNSEIFRPLCPSEREALREKLYQAAGDRTIIFCPRRWAPMKGVGVFVEAVARLLHSHPEMREKIVLAFAGSGYCEYPRYRDETAKALAAVDCRKVLLGDLDAYAMVSHYQCADLVVIPSFAEAVSLAALEAMACETAVIASAVGGMPEVIHDRATGFLVPAGDADALARVLHDLIRDSAVRITVGAAARRFVAGPLSWTAVAEATEQVLTRAVRTAGEAFEESPDGSSPELRCSTPASK